MPNGNERIHVPQGEHRGVDRLQDAVAGREDPLRQMCRLPVGNDSKSSAKQEDFYGTDPHRDFC